MNSLRGFFSSCAVPELNLSPAAKKKKWLSNFLKSFSVVFLTYMAMYLIRNNFKASSSLLKDHLALTTTQLGQIGVAFSLTYGLGKTILGYFADGRNTKRLISVLLILSALAVMGLGTLVLSNSPALGMMLVLWGANGLFQSVGGPLSYSTIFKWTPRSQRGRWLGAWNTSHNIGGAIAGMFALWGMNTFFAGHVAGMFIFPALVALVIGILTLFIGYDTPEEIGLGKVETIFNEPMEREDLETSNLGKWDIFKNYVLNNKWVWVLCIANVFVYIVRIGIDNWAPLYTRETFNFNLSQQANTIFYFELGALAASLTWGYLSDLLGGRRALVATFCLLCTAIALLGYRHGHSVSMINFSLFMLGMLIFGPQLLIGVSVTSFVPKRAVAVTNGTTGTFGYLFGDSIAKIGLAVIADPKAMGLGLGNYKLHGWHDTFGVFYAAIICGILLLGVVAYAEERKIRARVLDSNEAEPVLC